MTTPEDAEDALKVMSCVRLADMHYVPLTGGVIRFCSGCSLKVVVSKAGLATMERVGSMLIVCTSCADEAIEARNGKDVTIEISPEVQAEYEAWANRHAAKGTN